jgi:hypothetical protein
MFLKEALAKDTVPKEEPKIEIYENSENNVCCKSH